MAFFAMRGHWLFFTVAVVVFSGCSTGGSTDTVEPSNITQGPEGSDFYTPPAMFPAGDNGDLIWVREIDNNAALPSAAENWLALYRSTDIYGKAIAVTGTVAIPEGRPPEQGWPVISWTHGTTGIADRCAPSRNDDDYPAKVYVSLMNSTLNKWVQQGYAVVKTDYQGLGTPGTHPYLVGESQARSAIDMVRAARQLSPNLGSNWMVMGHSQGGQAALYTAYLGPLYAPDLNLTAAIAISPASHLSGQLQYALKNPNMPSNPYGALMLAGIAAADPQVDLSSLLTDEGRKRIKQVEERCVDEMRGGDGWTLPVDELMDLDVDQGALIQATKKMADAENVRSQVPLLILQADDDQAIPKFITDKLVGKYNKLGMNVEYRTFHVNSEDPEYNNHRLTVKKSAPVAMVWVQQYLPVLKRE